MNVPFINVEQAQRSLAIGCMARIPMGLVGGPGCGKTSAVNQFSTKLNAELFVKILAYAERTDLGGYPMPDLKADVMKFLLTPDIKAILASDPEKQVILFLDEFDRAPMDVQNATLQLLLGGDLNGHALPKNVFVVLAMNGISDLYTTALSEAARNRMCTLFMSARADGNAEALDKWAAENNIDPSIRGFVKFAPDLMKPYESFEELAIATPRSVVEYMNRILHAMKRATFGSEDLLLPILAGLVGQSVAAQYLAFRARWTKCPCAEDILKNPTTCIAPQEADVAFAVGCSLTAHLVVKKADRATLEKAVKYVTRLPADAANGILRGMQDRKLVIASIPLYQKWADANGDILGRG